MKKKTDVEKMLATHDAGPSRRVREAVMRAFGRSSAAGRDGAREAGRPGMDGRGISRSEREGVPRIRTRGVAHGAMRRPVPLYAAALAAAVLAAASFVAGRTAASRPGSRAAIEQSPERPAGAAVFADSSGMWSPAVNDIL